MRIEVRRLQTSADEQHYGRRWPNEDAAPRIYWLYILQSSMAVADGPENRLDPEDSLVLGRWMEGTSVISRATGVDPRN